MKTNQQPSQPYALFHVHRSTGERRRYHPNAFPATTEAEARQMVKRSQQAEALSNTADEWQTQAHPDQ
jgi:hypothetical protein